MENMLPGNSFPQICVVSVNKFVEKVAFEQEYVRSVSKSNRIYCLIINKFCTAPSPSTPAVGTHTFPLHLF